MKIDTLHHVLITIHLNHVDVGLSFHCRCIHKQGIEIPQHNIQSSVPMYVKNTQHTHTHTTHTHTHVTQVSL